MLDLSQGTLFELSFLISSRYFKLRVGDRAPLNLGHFSGTLHVHTHHTHGHFSLERVTVDLFEGFQHLAHVKERILGSTELEGVDENNR